MGLLAAKAIFVLASGQRVFLGCQTPKQMMKISAATLLLKYIPYICIYINALSGEHEQHMIDCIHLPASWKTGIDE